MERVWSKCHKNTSNATTSLEGPDSFHRGLMGRPVAMNAMSAFSLKRNWMNNIQRHTNTNSHVWDEWYTKPKSNWKTKKAGTKKTTTSPPEGKQEVSDVKTWSTSNVEGKTHQVSPCCLRCRPLPRWGWLGTEPHHKPPTCQLHSSLGVCWGGGKWGLMLLAKNDSRRLFCNTRSDG